VLTQVRSFQNPCPPQFVTAQSAPGLASLLGSPPAQLEKAADTPRALSPVPAGSGVCTAPFQIHLCPGDPL
jgi:hypothetical protein